MLASAVIARARVILNDASPGARWTDAELLERVKDAQLAFLNGIPGREGRTDWLLDSAGTWTDAGAISTTSSTLAIPDRYREAAAQYVAGSAQLDDNSDTKNAEIGLAHIKQALTAVFG